MTTENTTDVDDDVQVPEAEPLPPLDTPQEEAPAPLTASEGGENPQADDGQEEAEPPPLPPLLELAGSNLATAGGAAYGAAGAAGLLAVGAVATVGAVAYMARGSRKRAEQRARSGQGRRAPGRFRGLLGQTAGVGRGPGGSRGLAGSNRASTGGAGLGRSRFATAASGGPGRRGSGIGGAGGAGRGRFGAAGSRGGALRGTGRPGGLTGGAGRSGRSSGRFGGSGLSGVGGSRGRFGGSGLSGVGGSRGRFGGSPSRGFGGGSSGSPFGSGRGGSRGLFGAATKRARARGRTTAISDPAMPVGSVRRRPLRGAWRAARRGWDHPRVKNGRVRFKRASVRTRDYMRKRIRRARAAAFWQGLAGWWGRLWRRIRGDDRYGPMSSASATAAALSVALLGPSRRAGTPRRPLSGRIIGTSARTPGELRARDRLALGAGDTSGTAPLEGHTMARKPGEIIRAEAAADEMRAALAAFGSADVHMLTYEQGLAALPDLLRSIGAGLNDMSSVAEGEQPLHPAVLQYMHQISAAVHQVATVAEELPGLFRAAHETELQRLEAPRAGEHRWDASGRDD